MTFSAVAADSDGVVNRVEFLVDGYEVAEDASNPYSAPWTATPGSHTVQARAVDNDAASKTTLAVTITVADNQVPSVSLTAPTNGQSFITGTAVALSASASDTDGSVNRVEFLVDGAEIAQDTSSPYSASWAAASGSHTVQARAVDNLGKSKTTSAITITGVANQAPTVNLTAPGNGAPLTAGAAVALTASASDTDGSINRVEFLIDGTEVAQDTSSPYGVNWTALAGSHTVQARAVDNLGKTKTTSAITVQGTINPVVASATRQYVYNQYQQLCKAEEPETGATLMGYDAAGNLVWSATGLPAGTACDLEGDTPAILARKATRTYDARNRISALNFPDGNGAQNWNYWPDGLVKQITTFNDGGTTSVVNAYDYNKRRMLVAESSTQPGWYAWFVGYGYDANGHLSTQSYPDGLWLSYAPNALGQPTQAGTYATNVSYYPNGAMQSFTYGNGIVHTLTRNARGLPDRSLDAYGTTKYLDDGYDYDANGNVAAISDGATGQNQRGNRTMAYDGLNRLTAVQSPMYGTTGTAYGYDSLDNLVHVVAPGRDHYYCYDASNRLTNVKTIGCDTGATVIGLGYDVQGNLANKNGVAYTFDQGNRLRSVASLESYRYDGHGRRVLAWSPSQGNILSMYAQSGQLMFQQNWRNGVRNINYVSLGGSLIAIREYDPSAGPITIKYQHTDALGSPVAITNASRAVIERREYEPYGYQLTPSLQDGPNYTGHVADAATGLIYMQQRYYDPVIGRFLSRDEVTAYEKPLTNFNAYIYALNNPYRFTDPDGRNSVGEMIDSAAEGCGAVSCAGYAALRAVWQVFGSEGVSQIADKGWSNAGGGDKASAALEVAAVLPPVKILGEAAGALKTAVEVAEAAKGVAKGKNIVAPGGREAAKALFREADVAGKGGRTITKDATGGGRAVVGRTADGKPIRIRFKPDGTTRIQAADKKIIFPKEEAP